VRKRLASALRCITFEVMRIVSGVLNFFRNIEMLPSSGELLYVMQLFHVCMCSKNFGRALILDGLTQFTEKDEFGYQELLTSLPINCHPNPERVSFICLLDWKLTSFAFLLVIYDHCHYVMLLLFDEYYMIRTHNV